MPEKNRPITTLHDLLDHEAGQLINGELQLKNSLVEWIKKASSLKLKTVLQKYLELTGQHVQNLESFLKEEKASSIQTANRVMHALIEETDELLSQCTDPEIKDACQLACLQTINHFKISTYGTAAAFANALNMEKQASVFHEAEVNEKQIDDRLSQLAEHEINPKAKAPIVVTS